jgi:hypothetical protein
MDAKEVSIARVKQMLRKDIDIDTATEAGSEQRSDLLSSRYGLGSLRSVADFEQSAGVDFDACTVLSSELRRRYPYVYERVELVEGMLSALSGGDDTKVPGNTRSLEASGSAILSLGGDSSSSSSSSSSSCGGSSSTSCINSNNSVNVSTNSFVSATSADSDKALAALLLVQKFLN